MAVRLPWCCRRKATVFLTCGAQRCGGRPCSRPLHSGSYVKSTSVAGSDSSAPPKPSPKPLQEMPGVKGLPLLGNLNLVTPKNIGKPLDEINIMKLCGKYDGNFKVKVLRDWVVVVQTPEGVKAVSRAEGKYPVRGIEHNMKYIYDKAIQSPLPMFLSSDAEWKKTRSAASKQVVPRRVGNFVTPMCDIADNFITHLEGVMDEDGNISDITPEVSKWTFQSVSFFVYGEIIDTYTLKDPRQREFVEAGSDYIQSVTEISSCLPLYRIFPTKPYRRFVRITRRMKKAGGEILKNKIEMLKQTDSSHDEQAVGLLDQWLLEKKFTEEEALSNSYDMLSAGIDTTSNTSTNLLYVLAKNPDIQDRLLDEFSKVLGDKAYPSWEDLQGMPLLRNCVKEVMRLYSVVPMNARVLQEDVIIDGYYVPSRTPVVTVMNTITKNKDIFEDPMAFLPDRWDRDSKKIHPFASLPFGFGPRACYGRRLAELEVFVLMIRLLPKYKLSTSLDELKLKYGTTCSPINSVHMQLSIRK